MVRIRITEGLQGGGMELQHNERCNTSKIKLKIAKRSTLTSGFTLEMNTSLLGKFKKPMADQSALQDKIINNKRNKTKI